VREGEKTMDTIQSLLTDVLESVSVKRLDSGIFRAWGLGKGKHAGKVVYSDGASVETALTGIKTAIDRNQWRVDRYQRAF
jgi:hypothetical protein